MIAFLKRDTAAAEPRVWVIEGPHGWSLLVPDDGDRHLGSYPTKCDALRAAARSGYEIEPACLEDIR